VIKNTQHYVAYFFNYSFLEKK